MDRHPALPDGLWALALPISRIPAALAALAALQAALAARLLVAEPDKGIGSDLVDAHTVAVHLGVAESFVRTAARAGKIPSTRVGRYIRFRVADVEKALEDAS